jgi:ATPase subunit of ABC transporter with duplicated ATPase domains
VAWLERFLATFEGTVIAVTHDRFFLDNVAGAKPPNRPLTTLAHRPLLGWILELDRGAGIPFEGNYSAWLESRASRLATESGQQASRERALASELAFVRQQRSGQQKKGKARLRAYDSVYVALALLADEPILTLDGEVVERSRASFAGLRVFGS